MRLDLEHASEQKRGLAGNVSTRAISRKAPAISGSASFGQSKHGSRYRSMRRSNVALRLQESLLDEARRVSESEGVALNPFINVAVAEKLSALRTEDYFRERGAARATRQGRSGC